jgi:hypothetical protein
MLFSSGDFARTLSLILSGEGFDEREQGKSPLALLDFTGCAKNVPQEPKPGKISSSHGPAKVVPLIQNRVFAASSFSPPRFLRPYTSYTISLQLSIVRPSRNASSFLP